MEGKGGAGGLIFWGSESGVLLVCGLLVFLTAGDLGLVSPGLLLVIHWRLTTGVFKEAKMGRGVGQRLSSPCDACAPESFVGPS